MLNETAFYQRLLALEHGTYAVHYRNRRYLLKLEKLLEGRLIKLYARELGGNDIVSGNYYPTLRGGMLKPCEMSERKVIDFVMRLSLIGA
jgi:hypothetical protein